MINFSAGPAALPEVALRRAREELVDFEGTGMAVVEQSHRGPAYEAVQARVTRAPAQPARGAGQPRDPAALGGARAASSR